MPILIYFATALPTELHPISRMIGLEPMTLCWLNNLLAVRVFFVYSILSVVKETVMQKERMSLLCDYFILQWTFAVCPFVVK